MLTPDFNELVALRHLAEGWQVQHKRRAESALAGSYRSSFRGQGIEFEEVREYVAGDEIRNIDWRVTARTGKPHMKVFREERDRSVILCIDTSGHMQFGTRGTFKNIQAAKAAAILGWNAHQQHERVGALLFGGEKKGFTYIPPVKGRQSLWRMFRHLCEPGERGEGTSLTEALGVLAKSAPASSLVFVIADFNQRDAGFAKALSQARLRHQLVLLPIHDPADASLPNVGMLRTGNDVLINTSDAQAVKRYEQLWQQQDETLTSLCAGLNVPLIRLATNEPVQQSLMEGFRSLRMRRG